MGDIRHGAAGQNNDDNSRHILTRRRATYAELGEYARPIVKKLADKRLLVAGGDDPTRADQVEVAHEALIQNWPRLVSWLEEDRKFLLARQRLWRAVADWKDTGEENDALLRGQLLSNAEELLSSRPDDLSESVKGFIRRSAEQEERQRRELEEQRTVLERQRAVLERQHRELKRRRLARVVAAAAAVVAVTTILYGWWTSRQKRNVVSASGYAYRAGEAERANNLEEALENYIKAAQLGPDLPDPYLACAFIYSRRGQGDDYEKAVEYFDKYLAIETKSPVGFNGRGAVLLKMSERGQPQLRENALKDFERATEADPDFAPAWYNRASALLGMNRFDEAIDSFNRTLDTAPRFNEKGGAPRTGPVDTARVYNDRGRAFYGRARANGSPEDTQRAREDFEQAAALGAPQFAEPLFRLGVIYADQDQLTKAVEFYSRAVAMEPGYGEALNARGEARAKLGRAEEALKDFADAARHGYRPAYLNLGLAQLRLGESREAAENLDKALAYQPDPRAFLGRGQAFAAVGDQARAIKDFTSVLELTPDLIDAYYYRGVSYDESGDAENAKGDLLKFKRAVEHPEGQQDYNTPEYRKNLADARARLTKLGYQNTPADATVSLHYLDESERSLALQVETALRGAGFRRVTLVQSYSRDDKPLVKYFNRADRDNAFGVRNEVSRVYGRNINYWQMPPNPKLKRDTFGLIEVWLPPSAPRETQPGDDAPPASTPEPGSSPPN